jgi:hypothetical protein
MPNYWLKFRQLWMAWQSGYQKFGQPAFTPAGHDGS